MTNKILLSAALIILLGFNSFAQKGQRIAFVDMNYILENIPAYSKAQSQLDKKVVSWQQDLDKIKGEILTMQTDLSNEKALLTDDLIQEKEEDIVIKQLELKKAEEQYFSSNGNLFLLRKQLVTPIQDQVYNAAQEIAKARKYDFVFDKSSDLIMLYSNKSNDISDLVLRSIVRGEKISAANLKREEANNRSKKKVSNVVTPTPRPVSKTTSTSSSPNSSTPQPQGTSVDDKPEVSVVDEREAKREAALAKIEQQKLDRAKKREDQKAAIEKKRLERLKKTQDVRKELKDKKEGDPEDKKEDSKEEKEDDKKDNNN